MKYPFIVGRQTYLRGLLRDDLTGPMFQWTNDREVTRYLYRGAFPNCIEQMERAYQAMLDSSTEIELALIDAQSDVHIGVVGLHGINSIARHAEFRILIGDKRFWGQGYGTEATMLTAVYGFEVLNLHKIHLGVSAVNLGAIRCYEKAGYMREGELRDEIYRNGRYYNAVRMSLLETEYRKVSNTWPLTESIQQQFPGRP